MEKYTKSMIDNNTYCRKNGQFKRHLKQNGFDYQSYYETFMGEPAYCACGRKCKFLNHQMKFTKTCGSAKCVGLSSSNTKQTWDQSRWNEQRKKYRQTIDSKDDTEKQEWFDKRKRTFLTKYGVDHPWKNKDIRKKISDTMNKRYGVSNISNTYITDETRKYLEDRQWLYEQHYIKKLPLYQISKMLNVGDKTVGKYLKNHGLVTQHYTESFKEKQLTDYVKSVLPSKQIITNNRDILPNKQELDIYLPDLNIAIEFCGLYWHSDAYGRIDKNYHKNKFDMCSNRGITLLTIFEDEWDLKQTIVKQMISHRLQSNIQQKIYARNTEVKQCEATVCKEICEKYHVQGYGKGSIKYQLTYNGAPVAVIQVAKHKEELVISRYVTAAFVVGGFGKLFNHLLKEHQPKRVVTFADKRWTIGNVYEKLGFVNDIDLPPDYSYIQSGVREHKFNFRRKQLEQKLSNFDPTLSEAENCSNHGIARIWDCGKKRFVYDNT